MFSLFHFFPTRQEIPLLKGNQKGFPFGYKLYFFVKGQQFPGKYVQDQLHGFDLLWINHSFPVDEPVEMAFGLRVLEILIEILEFSNIVDIVALGEVYVGVPVDGC